MPAQGGLGLDGVEVEARGQAGIFEWAALTSTGSNALLTWLNANGFRVSAEADGIDRALHILANHAMLAEMLDEKHGAS